MWIATMVLFVYGPGDVVMILADSDAISVHYNRVHPGAARNYTVERMNHLFTIDGKFYDPLVPEILSWMKEQLADNWQSSSQGLP